MSARSLILCFLIAGSMLVHGCSSGGSDPVVTGTAATGAAIADQIITLRDSNGLVVIGMTDADGTYRLPAGGLTPPFLLRVELPGGGALFGIGFEPGTNNVHPVTDLLVESFFDAQGLDVETEFATFGPASVAPTEVEMEGLSGILEEALDLSLDNTIDPDDREEFDFFTYQFDADSTGFDLLLDNTTAAGGSITVTLVDSTQSTTIAVDDTTRTVDFTTDTTTADGTTTDNESLSLPDPEDADALSTATASVEATIQSLAVAMTVLGGNLTEESLENFFDEEYLDDGDDRDDVLETLASLAGATVTSSGIDRIVSFDAENGILVVNFSLIVTVGQTSVEVDVSGDDGFAFRQQEDESWLGFGNQRIAEIELTPINSQVYQGGGDGTATPVLRASIRGPSGTLESVAITGIFPPDDTELTVDLDESGDDEQDVFGFSGGDRSVTEFPAPGTTFDVAVTPVGAQEATVYEFPFGSSTTETIAFTTYNDVARAEFVGEGFPGNLPGSPLTFVWTLPSSFEVDEIEARVIVSSAGGSETLDVGDLETDSTSGTVNIPSTVSGSGITQIEVIVEIVGEDGQAVSAIETFSLF